MKYVVLSFDDGLLDFKNNALPLLNKYSMKATVNIITGKSDKTIKSGFEYLSIEDIKELHEKGFEIAAHSNSHLDCENIDDISKSLSKIKEWTAQNKIGVIMPKSQNINDDLLNFLENDDRVLYFADWRDEKTKVKFVGNIYRILSRIFKNKSSFIVSYGFKVLYDEHSLYKYSVARFNRITVKKDREVKYFIKLLRLIPNKTCLTIVFHSIVNDYNEIVDWPEGAWDVKQFECLLSYLSNNKKIKVITQKEAIEINKNYTSGRLK